MNTSVRTDRNGEDRPAKQYTFHPRKPSRAASAALVVMTIVVCVGTSYALHAAILWNGVPFGGPEMARKEWFVAERRAFWLQQSPLIAAIVSAASVTFLTLRHAPPSVGTNLQRFSLVWTALLTLLTPGLWVFGFLSLCLGCFVALWAIPVAKEWLRPVVVFLICAGATAWSFWYVREWFGLFGD